MNTATVNALALIASAAAANAEKIRSGLSFRNAESIARLVGRPSSAPDFDLGKLSGGVEADLSNLVEALVAFERRSGAPSLFRTLISNARSTSGSAVESLRDLRRHLALLAHMPERSSGRRYKAQEARGCALLLADACASVAMALANAAREVDPEASADARASVATLAADRSVAEKAMAAALAADPLAKARANLGDAWLAVAKARAAVERTNAARCAAIAAVHQTTSAANIARLDEAVAAYLDAVRRLDAADAVRLQFDADAVAVGATLPERMAAELNAKRLAATLSL